MRHSSGLDIEVDRPLQERIWAAERAGWLLFALFILLALAGLTGKGGPLSRAVEAGPEGSIDYPRVARWQTSDEIRVTLNGSGAPQAIVELDSSFSRLLQIESVQPAPSTSSLTQQGLRLTFEVDGGALPSTVLLSVLPVSPAVEAEIGVRLNGGERLVLSPTILP